MSLGTPPADLPEALRDKRSLAPDEEFCFGCTPDIPCFTDCCGNVNILLTPVDVLKLSRRLRLTTTQFLDKHAMLPVTKDLQLPVAMLKMDDGPNKPCPFVGEKGCTVYEDRPWSCRMYPIGMGLPPARAGEEPKPLFFLFEDGFCKGHGVGGTWTVDRWRDDQGVEEREQLEAGFREIVSHPWFIGGRQLDPKRLEIFFTATYDLDSFRRFVFESSFLKRFVVEDELVEQLRDDDEALLRFGYRWLRFALFAEPTIAAHETSAAG